MNALVDTDWTLPKHFITLTLIFFVIVFLRYVILSGLYHQVFFGWLKDKFRQRILVSRDYNPQQIIKEVVWSGLTSLIFSIMGVSMLILWQKGFTRLYVNLNEFSFWYLPVSLILYMFIHETYYYWLHRWMHLPGIFRRIHKVHHDSIQTSSWTSFSFHPYESILQAIIIPLLLFVIPIHIYMLLVLLILMTLSAIVNHAGVEVYPEGFEKDFFGKWMIGAAHHDLHHKKYKYNFGLYFTCWDKWMKTESPDFDILFREKTNPGLPE